MRHLMRRDASRQQELVASLDAFVVLTEWARQAVIRNGAPSDKVVLNRLGIKFESEPRRSAASAAPGVIGYVGRFEELKGILVLAEAMRAIPPDIPLKLEFRGPVGGDAEQAVVQRAKEMLRGDQRVLFGAPVVHDEVPALLRSFDLLCCPSLALEGGPTVALESMAVGTPVIGSRIGGLAEIVRDGVDGALFEPGDSAALAERIAQAARQPSLIDRWREALQPVRTMRNVAKDYLALYERLLVERTGSSTK